MAKKSTLNDGLRIWRGKIYSTHKNGHEAGDQHLSPGSTKNGLLCRYLLLPILENQEIFHQMGWVSPIQGSRRQITWVFTLFVYYMFMYAWPWCFFVDHFGCIPVTQITLVSIGKDLLLEEKQRTNGFQVRIGFVYLYVYLSLTLVFIDSNSSL